MVTLFADGFDQWGSTADMLAVYTASGNGNMSGTTPFGVGQSYAVNNVGSTAPFTTGTNETTVYGCVRWRVNSGSSGQNCSLTFNDGGSAQCTIRWNGDGSVSLYTGSAAGTLIQTYATQYTTTVWNSYQFKIVIDNTVGSIEIRQNGATSNTITKTGINTRGGTSVAQVNSVSFNGTSGFISCNIDDLFLTNSGWPGDMRAIQQVPLMATQSQFTVFPTTTNLVASSNITTVNCTNGLSYYMSFTASVPGTIGTLNFTTNASATGNIKFAIFDSTGPGGNPGSSLGTSNVVNNPVSGLNTATWSTPVYVTKNAAYWMGWSQDTTIVLRTGSGGAGAFGAIVSSATPYASFPASNPSLSAVNNSVVMTAFITNENAAGVGELVENQDTTYVYATSLVQDKYALSAITTSYAVTAVQVYVMWKKPDVGQRTAALSIATHGSVDTTLVTDSLVPSNYVYRIKTMDVDTTGAAWTAANINGAIIGVAITA